MHDVVHFQHADGSPFPREKCDGLYSVLQSGVVHRSDDDTFTRKDGRMLPVAYSAAPIRVEGRVNGVVVVFHDLTDRRQAERAVRESEAKLRLIASQLPAYIWTTARALRMTSMLGMELSVGHLDSSLYVGRLLDELLDPANQAMAEAIAAHRQALHGEPAEYLLPSRGRHFESRVEPLRDAQGQIIGCPSASANVANARSFARPSKRSAQS